MCQAGRALTRRGHAEHAVSGSVTKSRSPSVRPFVRSSERAPGERGSIINCLSCLFWFPVCASVKGVDSSSLAYSHCIILVAGKPESVTPAGAGKDAGVGSEVEQSLCQLCAQRHMCSGGNGIVAPSPLPGFPTPYEFRLTC